MLGIIYEQSALRTEGERRMLVWRFGAPMIVAIVCM